MLFKLNDPTNMSDRLFVRLFESYFISKSKIVMEIISNLFEMAPFVALFITLSLGYMD